MSKTILLIENDVPFAAEMSGALEAMGFNVRATGDGKEGLDLARDLKPDAIVLCVELPRLSGYSICNKIKKDEALKGIPLILTSSEATEEVFEDHRKLKVRAEEYLIKPYVSAVLLERLTTLVGLPEVSAQFEPSGGLALDEPSGDEEVVSLEEEFSLEAFAAEPGEEVPALDLDSLPDEPAAPLADSLLDDDLRLLDDAFDGLSSPATPAAPVGSPETSGVAEQVLADGAPDATAGDEATAAALGIDRPAAPEDLEVAPASLPEEDESLARPDLGGAVDEADLALGALTEAPALDAPSAFDALEDLEGPTPTLAATAPATGAAPLSATAAPVAAQVAAATLVGAATGAAVAMAGVSTPGADLAELARLEAELAERRASLSTREAEIRDLKTRLEAAVRRAEESESSLGEQEAEVASLRARGDTLTSQARKADAEAKAAREEARRSSEQASEAAARADVAEARAAASEARAASAESRASASEARSRAAEQEAAEQRRAAEQAATAVAAAQAAAARMAEVERESERLETELVVARGEVEGARSELERRSNELKRRITELEAANSKNEERVVKAYLKIKGDEKVRDKARKALAIALQLLDEGLPPEPVGEKRAPPRPVPE